MTKGQMEDYVEARVQPFRPHYSHTDSNGGLFTVTSTASRSDTAVVHIDIHLDPSGKEIVLWDDILVAFKSAVHVRHNTRVLSFLRDKQLNIIEPRRIAAVPSATLDVYIEGNITQERRGTAMTYSASPHTLPPRKRDPEYDPQEQAYWKLKSLGDLTISTPASTDESTNTNGTEDSDVPSPAGGSPTTPTLFNDIKGIEVKAKQGDISAQFELGRALFSGQGDVTKDFKEAMDWFLLAAERKHPRAQHYVGLMYYQGNGVSVDYKAAAAWFLKAANQQVVQSQFLLGMMYLHGHGIQKDSNFALQWLLSAANNGHAAAKCNIGNMYETGTSFFSQDYSKAMEWYRKAADQNHASAQFQIGALYLSGNGVLLRDEATALEWFLKAAKQGDSASQSLAGTLYRTDPGLRDYSKAMKWYLKAANQDDATAQHSLGEMYETGHQGVVEKDYSKAMEWYIKAAKQGNLYAQERLGNMYYEGRGLKHPNYFKAREWYLKAAKQNSRVALYGLAMMYKKGLGVDQNFGEAKRLFGLINAIDEFLDTEREEALEEKYEQSVQNIH
ncbi:hypothetical protein EC991_010098 [Linnemannia zychae]|nr:hypothetical protein EC991_010098 [Linnemannia zychae]